jgi:hypothetical protein
MIWKKEDRGMNCTECNGFQDRGIFQGKGTKKVCMEILDLLYKLDIPHEEQVILLNMADTRLGCNSFKNILFALYEKYKLSTL